MKLLTSAMEDADGGNVPDIHTVYLFGIDPYLAVPMVAAVMFVLGPGFSTR